VILERKLNMDLREAIDTVEDRENWKEFLLTYSKEELAELILDRMIRDINFSRDIYCKLSKQGEDSDMVISAYEAAVKKETDKKVADIDYLELLSKKAMKSAESTEDLLEQLRLYVSVIVGLDSEVVSGAGYEEENEDVLFQVMNECGNQMLRRIGEKHGDLTADGLGAVYNFLKSESEKYDPLDGDNRIETAFKKLIMLAMGSNDAVSV
jgi:hypothetical protein